uniref:Senescence-associated protein n=1 Tax=Salix viminalis TaxID=40686 RepID=A0A6N2KZC7_SALVM
MFEEKKHLQLIHERSTALNGTNNHQSPSSKPRVRAMLEPMTFLNQYTVPNSVTAESSWHCLRCHHGEIAAMIKTRSNPLSKPRAHAMTCMNQKRAAEFTGIAFAAETADTAESAAIALFDPVTAGLYSRRATARAPPSPRVPGPGNSRPSLREAVLLEGLGGTNRSDMGLNLSGSWQQGHSATYNTPSRGPRGSSTARAWPTARASGAKRPLLQVGNRTAGARVASSPDSDLEAFSHNPTHGSFAPLAFQPSAMTNSHVPYWWVNNPTLGEFCFTMIGRADIEGSKSNVAMNAWLPQASYPCGNFSDTSSFKFRRSKGSIGHAFTVRIRTGNQNQTSFYPFVPHEISVLVELILGHLRYLLTDVPPQPNSPPDNVFRPDRPPKRPWVQKEGQRPASDSRNNRIPLVRTSSESTVRRPGRPRKGRSQSVPRPARDDPLSPREQLEQSTDSRRVRDWDPRAQPSEPILFPRLRIHFATSLAYIVHRPEAVHLGDLMRLEYDGLGGTRPPDFKGRRGAPDTTRLRSFQPLDHLRLSRFQGGGVKQKITLPSPADVSGLPTILPFLRSSRANALSAGSPVLGSTNPCASAFTEPSPSASKFSFEYLLHSRSAPTAVRRARAWCSDRRAPTHGAWRCPTAGECYTLLSGFRLHDHRPAVLIATPCGSSTQLPTASASRTQFCTNGPGLPRARLKHRQLASLSQIGSIIAAADPVDAYVSNLRLRGRLNQTVPRLTPLTPAPCQTPRPCSRRDDGEPRPMPERASSATPCRRAAASHDRSDGFPSVQAPGRRHAAIRIGQREPTADRLSRVHIRRGASPAPIHFLPTFPSTLDSLKSFHLSLRTCLSIGSRHTSLGPEFTARLGLHSSTRLADRLVSAGSVTTGLSPLRRPSGDWAGPPLRTPSPDYTSERAGPDSQAGHFRFARRY